MPAELPLPDEVIVRILRILFSTSPRSLAPVHTAFPCLRAHILVALRNTLHINLPPDTATLTCLSTLFRTDAHTLSLPRDASAACEVLLTPALRQLTIHPPLTSHVSRLSSLRVLTLHLDTAQHDGLYASIRPLDLYQLHIHTTHAHTLAHTLCVHIQTHGRILPNLSALSLLTDLHKPPHTPHIHLLTTHFPRLLDITLQNSHPAHLSHIRTLRVHLHATEHVPFSVISHLTHVLHTYHTSLFLPAIHLPLLSACTHLRTLATGMHPAAETSLRLPTRLASLTLRWAPVVALPPAGPVSRYHTSARGALVRLVETLPALADLHLHYVCIAPGDVRAVLRLLAGRLRRFSVSVCMQGEPCAVRAARVVGCVWRCNGNLEELRFVDRVARRWDVGGSECLEGLMCEINVLQRRLPMLAFGDDIKSDIRRVLDKR